MAKRRLVKPTSRDPVTRYARDVVSGKIIAGPHVRDACRRHLTDLELAPARGFFFDLDKVERAIGYYRDVLRLKIGEGDPKPFALIDWEAFIVGSLFGWVDVDGLRRFRLAYVETAKGSGKSPLAAGIGLYGLTADGEPDAEVYAAATKRDQAMVLFRDAVAMRDRSPALARVNKSGRAEKVYSLSYISPQTGLNFFHVLGADEGESGSGKRPHITLLDEIHEHKTGYVVETLKAGQKSRPQPLTFMITNSGTDKRTVCWEYHDLGTKVAARQIQDDSFFAYICANDEGDDPFKDERCWIKTNPSLKHGLPSMKYLRDQVAQARNMPGKESIVRRLNFCQWVESESPWIGGDTWFQAAPEPEYNDGLLYGRKCWGGLDLGSTTDLTAMVLLFEPTEADPWWRIKPYFWLPGDGLHDKADKDRVPYIAWRDAGHLTALPGRAINKIAVLHKLAEIVSLYDVQGLAYDEWRIADLLMLIQQEGLAMPPMQPFRQGFKSMAPAVDEFERLLLGAQLKHDGNPVMTWNAANAVVITDPAGNRKVAKERATGRVDGIVAAVMAAGLTIQPNQTAPMEPMIMIM